jgi:hypothetical protein
MLGCRSIVRAMTASWLHRASLALVLLVGCDRGSRATPDAQDEKQAEAVPATPGPAPAQVAGDASSESHAGSSEATVSPKAEPAPGVPPEPAAKPAVEPSSGYYGNAADELAAIYASLAPSSASAEAIGKQAWAHHKAEEFHEAGQAFARLTQLEPEVWKHPFNAACAAVLRSDLDRAQVFLVEALRRGGDEVRAKARKDGDLDSLRRRDDFELLMSAGPDELATWEIREPSFELEPYPAGEAALVIHELGAKAMPPASAGRYYAEHIAVTLKVERTKSSSENYRVAATCKSRGQYLHHSVRLEADERKLPVGKTETFALDLFNVAWIGSRSLGHCEIHVAGRGDRDYDGRYRLIASYCASNGEINPGACTDFERPSHRLDAVVEVGAEILIDAIGQRPRFDVWTAFELGARPDFMRGLSATITCKVGGEITAEPVYIPHVSSLELGRPGETVQILSSLFFDERPTWCQVEYFRTRHGPRDMGSVPTYCFEQGQLEPRSCS